MSPLRRPARPLRVYFAGKVYLDDYRSKLFHSRVMSDGYREYLVDGGSVIYSGPFAISCEHGCFHGTGMHGWGSGDIYECGSVADCPEFPHETVEASEANSGWADTPESVVRRCLSQIEASDAVHAYIDTLDCPGTLAELGYATALNKPIYVVCSMLDSSELWFIQNLPSVVHWQKGGPKTIHPDLLYIPSKHQA